MVKKQLIFFENRLFVIAFAKQVHGGAKLVEIDDRTYKNKRAEEIPFPEIARLEIVVDLAVVERFFNAARYMIMPNGNDNGNREEGKNIRYKVIHRLVAISFGIDLV